MDDARDAQYCVSCVSECVAPEANSTLQRPHEVGWTLRDIGLGRSVGPRQIRVFLGRRWDPGGPGGGQAWCEREPRAHIVWIFRLRGSPVSNSAELRRSPVDDDPPSPQPWIPP